MPAATEKAQRTKQMGLKRSLGALAMHPWHRIKGGPRRTNRRSDQEMYRRSRSGVVPHQYFLGRGGISDVSTGSNSNFGSSASGAKYALVVFIQFLSSRSGKSGL